MQYKSFFLLNARNLSLRLLNGDDAILTKSIPIAYLLIAVQRNSTNTDPLLYTTLFIDSLLCHLCSSHHRLSKSKFIALHWFIARHLCAQSIIPVVCEEPKSWPIRA